MLEESILSKEKYHLILLIYGILKNDTSELIYKTENEPMGNLRQEVGMGRDS